MLLDASPKCEAIRADIFEWNDLMLLDASHKSVCVYILSILINIISYMLSSYIDFLQ